MRFASLGSGSAGNALLVAHNHTHLLLDCGFSIKETVLRLQRLAVDPEQINAILLTHEHDDHASGVFKFAAQYHIPVWLSYGTFKSIQPTLGKTRDSLQIKLLDSQQIVAIQDIEIYPYTVPHDAREPLQFVFHDGQHRLGVLTDAGHITPHMTRMLTECHALVLECNHDATMLDNSTYNHKLKQRIRSRWGHLENQQTAQLLRSLDTRHLQHIVAAHLSEKNNTPQLASTALASALACETHWIGIADQAHGFDWRACQA